jgi:hypothetical protein
MSAARGLPDLGAAIALEDGTLFGAVEEPAAFVRVAGALELAARPDGAPELALEVVRGRSPFLAPAPYGVLDLRVRAAADGPAALEAARERHPAATVSPAVFAGGHVRLRLIGGADTVDAALRAELEAPMPVASNGLDGGRIIARLSAEAALLLRDALAGGALTFTAQAEMVLRGLAPRAAATVTFSPRALSEALRARADAGGRIAEAAIVALWAAPDGVALLASTGVEDRRAELARVLADWTTAGFAEPAAAAAGAAQPTVRLRADAPAGEAPMTWDLSEGRTTTRTVVLALDAFEAARRAVATGGLAAIWRETVVPPLETGVVRIEVDTNLPEQVGGLVGAGVELRSPPQPPDRVHALSGALLLSDPAAARQLSWRLSPREVLRYEYTTFALVRSNGHVRRLDGPPKSSQDRHLLLGPGDLPVDFVSIAAGRALLRETLLMGICRMAAGDEIAFRLTAEQPSVSLALAPGEAATATIELEARSPAGGEPVGLGPFPARSLALDLASFPQYGPQTVEIAVDFDAPVSLVALELVSEQAADGERPTVLSFTPAASGKTWRYLNASPFRAGYRYRVLGSPRWSDPQPAGRPLRLAASHLLPEDPPVIEPFRFGDLECAPGSEPGAFEFLPLAPGPERTPDGTPTFMTFPLGDDGLVQGGARLGASEAELEALRAELGRRLGVADPSGLRLQPARVTVEAAVLLVSDGAGGEQELARSQTSGFPPHDALFSARVDARQLAAARSALEGEAGRLAVRYDVRTDPDAPPLELRADVATWFTPSERP